MASPATWMLLGCACLAACTQDYLEIAFENEPGPYQMPTLTYPVGAGLMIGVNVFHVIDAPGDECPEIDQYAASDVTLAITGGTPVPCDVQGYVACIAVDSGAAELDVVATTANGTVGTSRAVVSDLSLAIATPSWGGAPVTALQLLASTSTQADLSFTAGSGEQVSGHVDNYTTSGPIAMSGGTITTGAAGSAAIAPVGVTGVTPLAIRVVTQAQSLASIAQFTINRELDGGDTSLSVYTDAPGDAPIDESDFYLDGFDAGGYLALPDLPVAASGPDLAPTGLTGGPCATIEYCFPHASLPDGVDEADTYIELVAGSADQRIPVHVVRAAN